ncbi:MAG: zinc ribbon domain-containing protein [Clostridia bacterium]|nr:zinc ribbon domain-containing protein [Clostridia bacterium]
MPSGRGISGGSFGGHGGGGHFGGGGFSGGHDHGHSYGPRYRRRGMVHGQSVVIIGGFGGRSYYVPNRIGSGIYILRTIASFLFVGAVILLVMGYLIALTNTQRIQRIESDYQEYQLMVKRAQSDPNYKTTANVLSIKKSDSSNKYCLIYKFKTSEGNSYVEGYTFYTYTYDEAYEAEYIQKVIEIAIDDLNTEIDRETNSIDMRYGQTKLEDDGEYAALTSQGTKNTEVGLKVSGYLALAFSVALGVASIVLYIKKRKLYEEEEAKKEEQKEEAVPVEQTTEKPKSKFCVYCGSKISEQDKKCSSCGASIQRD